MAMWAGDVSSDVSHLWMVTEDTALSRSLRKRVWSKQGAPQNPIFKDGWEERCPIGMKSKGRGHSKGGKEKFFNKFGRQGVGDKDGAAAREIYDIKKVIFSDRRYLSTFK